MFITLKTAHDLDQTISIRASAIDGIFDTYVNAVKAEGQCLIVYGNNNQAFVNASREEVLNLINTSARG